MELYHLRTFVAVAGEGNLSRAAVRLNLSQPAVSAHVKSLEEELGVSLFTRTPKGMELTDSGRRLASTAREALGRAQQLLDDARLLRGGVSGAIFLTRNTDPEFLRLPQLLDALNQDHPEALVHIDCCDSYDVAQALKDGACHGGFAYGCFDDDPRVTALPLAMVPVRVVGPLKWKDKLESASVEDLGGMPWVWFNERCPFVAMAEKLLAEGGCCVNTAAVINDEHTIRSLVSAGKGLSLLRDDMARACHLGQELAIWPGGALGIPINLVVLTRRLDEPEVKAVLEAASRVWGVSEATAAA